MIAFYVFFHRFQLFSVVTWILFLEFCFVLVQSLAQIWVLLALFPRVAELSFEAFGAGNSGKFWWWKFRFREKLYLQISCQTFLRPQPETLYLCEHGEQLIAQKCGVYKCQMCVTFMATLLQCVLHKFYTFWMPLFWWCLRGSLCMGSKWHR